MFWTLGKCAGEGLLATCEDIYRTLYPIETMRGGGSASKPELHFASAWMIACAVRKITLKTSAITVRGSAYAWAKASPAPSERGPYTVACEFSLIVMNEFVIAI